MIGETLNKIEFPDFTWIDLKNPSYSQIQDLANEYDLDYFLVKDSLEVGHLPKIEIQDDINFMIIRSFTADLEKNNAENLNELTSKIAIFFREDLLITIYKSGFEFVENFYTRNNSNADIHDIITGIIRQTLNTFREPAKYFNRKVDEAEETIFLKDYSQISLEDIYYQKADTRLLRKLLIMTKSVLNQYKVHEEAEASLQDIKDLLVKLVLEYEEAIEDINNLMNTYISVATQKNNDVMKLLTVFSAFFLPLTFIAGVYGMNFDVMPELNYKYAYFIILGIMFCISFGIFLWFKKKKII